jgi:hypothetical protein
MFCVVTRTKIKQHKVENYKEGIFRNHFFTFGMVKKNCGAGGVGG